MMMTGTKTGMSPSHLPTSRIQSQQKQEVLSEETAGPPALPWSCHLTSRCKSWGNRLVGGRCSRMRLWWDREAVSLSSDHRVWGVIWSCLFVYLALSLEAFLSEIYVPFNDLPNTLFCLYQLMTYCFIADVTGKLKIIMITFSFKCFTTYWSVTMTRLCAEQFVCFLSWCSHTPLWYI